MAEADEERSAEQDAVAPGTQPSDTQRCHLAGHSGDRFLDLGSHVQLQRVDVQAHGRHDIRVHDRVHEIELVEAGLGQVDEESGRTLLRHVFGDGDATLQDHVLPLVGLRRGKKDGAIFASHLTLVAQRNARRRLVDTHEDLLLRRRDVAPGRANPHDEVTLLGKTPLQLELQVR